MPRFFTLLLAKFDIQADVLKGSRSEHSNVQYLVKRCMEYAMLDML